MDLLSGDIMRPMTVQPPASAQQQQALPASTPAAASPAARPPIASGAGIAVSFTVRGLVQMQAVADRQQGKGTSTTGWGGLKKALNQVVGERQDTMQITIEAGSALMFSSELVPDMEEAEEVHFSRVAHLPSPGTMPDVEYLRLVLWASTKAATGMTTTKRTPLGEVSLTLGELQPLKLKGLNPYTRRLHSEKFPGAEVLIWSTPDANLHAISLAPGGMASVAPAKFNPMIERFTFIKIDLLTGLPMTPPLTALPTPPPEDPLLSAVALPPAPAAALAPTPSQPPASPWQYQSQPATQAPPSIVTVQEMTVEPKFSVSLPLELLRPLYSMLKVASQAWQGRVEMERIRQGYFSSNAEAFAEGRVLVKVNISEAAALDGIALYSAGAASMGSVTTAAMAAAAATSTSPTGTQPSTPVPEMSPEFGGGNALSPPAGGSAGGAGAQGGFKLSNMKRLGGKAMALAKNAAQANVGRQVAQLGVSASPADKALKNCNFYAKVVHVSAAADAPGGIAQRRDRTRVIGKTNTEYATCAPVWNSNRNRAACQHNQPRTQHMVAGSARVEVNAASEGVEVGEEDGPVQGLDLCFYLKQSDLLKGHLCITLYQETYSMRGGVVDTPIGEVNIPLSAVSISPDDGPCHTNVQWYPVGNYTPSSTLSTPAVLVGLCIQDKAMNNASDTTPQNQTPPGHQRNASSGGGSTMDAAVVYYDGDDSDDGDDSEDSDADDGGDKRGERGAGGGGGGGHSPSPSVSPARPALAHAVLSRWKVGDCYEWMRHIGKGGDMIDIQTLAHMYEETEYPLAWCEAHARAVGQQAAMIARVGKLYTQMMQDQRTFRGSQEKKNKDLQFIATNLHAQIWSTLPAPGSTVVHFDMTTTGAPSAHALGFKHGGLVSLEGALSALKRRVMAAWSSTAAGPAAPGGAPSGARTEQEQEAFARLLMEYEMKSLAVSIRRAVVTSQVLSITACNFATKLEMMALGTLSRGEELARKWAATGYLISFEGLLSVQGKEHGMVEDTVAAMSILQTYAVHVKASDQPSGLEVTLDTEAHVLTAQVGAKIMARLPEAIRAALSSAAGCYRAPIVPVFFTQGIDIAQSMSNQTSAKTRGSFQADINASSFHKLNQYCTKFYSEADTANPADPRPLVTHMHLLRLEAAVMAQQHNQKNTAVLLESERAVQLLGGGRVTFCKSGKDRTAMSVTLEESFMLLDKHLDGVGGEARALRVANVLRAHGTRIAVAEKNIGSPLYSFNAIQRQFIPELYRAPVQTIQDVLTSFQKRDS